VMEPPWDVGFHIAVQYCSLRGKIWELAPFAGLTLVKSFDF